MTRNDAPTRRAANIASLRRYSFVVWMNSSFIFKRMTTKMNIREKQENESDKRKRQMIIKR
jgi:hypothetical protein